MYSLINFELLPNGLATILYDDCTFDDAIVTTYQWQYAEDGWLSLRPAPGETTLRFLALDEVDTIRVQLIEPCRELAFEVDGHVDPWTPFFPGASCWEDKCTTGSVMQVDYCEGEEPEEACP